MQDLSGKFGTFEEVERPVLAKKKWTELNKRYIND